jgi:hypothetical protein
LNECHIDGGKPALALARITLSSLSPARTTISQDLGRCTTLRGGVFQAYLAYLKNLLLFLDFNAVTLFADAMEAKWNRAKQLHMSWSVHMS